MVRNVSRVVTTSLIVPVYFPFPVCEETRYRTVKRLLQSHGGQKAELRSPGLKGQIPPLIMTLNCFNRTEPQLWTDEGDDDDVKGKMADNLERLLLQTL